MAHVGVSEFGPCTKYSVLHSHLDLTTSTTGQDKTEVNKTNKDWTAQIYAIRDAQDQAAFAELFAHFAPRVKGFLIKSGADASLATWEIKIFKFFFF